MIHPPLPQAPEPTEAEAVALEARLLREEQPQFDRALARLSLQTSIYIPRRQERSQTVILGQDRSGWTDRLMICRGGLDWRRAQYWLDELLKAKGELLKAPADNHDVC